MNNQESLIAWGKDLLASKGYLVTMSPAIILQTPWSTVIRFSTTTGDFYLKQTPSDLFLASEPKILQIMSQQLQASVPVVIETNDDLHCFIMQDAGKPLRLTLKDKFDRDLLCMAIKEFAAVLRSTEDHIDLFLELDVPDWRLNKLPMLYQQIINQTDFINLCGLTKQEVQILHARSAEVSELCQALASYGIPQTLGYHDFHDKNILYNAKTKKITFADFGETAIIHPFLALYNCLPQAITHHGVKEGDQTYLALQAACAANWLDLIKPEQVPEVFALVKQLHPIYSVLACYKFIECIDLDAYKAHYNGEFPPAKYFREYIRLVGNQTN